MLKSAAILFLSFGFAAVLPAAEEKAATETVDIESWHAGNDTANIASLQRGARNFMNYCVGCHSLKYVRYSRMASDLHITTAQLQANLMPITARPSDYIETSLNGADAVAWFGKEPPDLSLIVRAREGGADYVYRFLKAFYTDKSRSTRTNNLVFENTAMPAVLSDLSGVQDAVYRNVDVVTDGKPGVEKVFSHFETSSPGRMTAADFDGFVRDTVNFLSYASEPTQTLRRTLGVWVVLFLVALTWMAWLLKQEYWKDVH